MPMLPLAPIDKVMRTAGAKRISDSAKIAMAELVEDFIIKITKKAAELAAHAKRNTVKGEDVKLAGKTQ